mgnify:CR=1 FL=1
MLIQTSRFGQLDVNRDRLIRFEEGILGFPKQKEYALIQTGDGSGFYWLQSVDTPDLAFVVSDPRLVLVLSAVLLTLGAVGVLTRRGAIVIFMCVELMLNAVNINLVAFWHYHSQLQGVSQVAPQVFVAIVFIVAAAEVAIGLALIISAYRRRETSVVDEMTLLKG